MKKIINPNTEYAKGYYDGYKQAIAEVEKMIDKYLKDFEKLIEKRKDEPVVMAGINNKFCAIQEYWDLNKKFKQELQKLKEKNDNSQNDN